MNDENLYALAKQRVQRILRGRCISDKDIIINQEKEIQQYREKIERILENVRQEDRMFTNRIEINIGNEDYIIMYNNTTDAVLLNTNLIKLIEEKETYAIKRNGQFYIINKTRSGHSIDIVIED